MPHSHFLHDKIQITFSLFRIQKSDFSKELMDDFFLDFRLKSSDSFELFLDDESVWFFRKKKVPQHASFMMQLHSERLDPLRRPDLDGDRRISQGHWRSNRTLDESRPDRPDD